MREGLSFGPGLWVAHSGMSLIAELPLRAPLRAAPTAHPSPESLARGINEPGYSTAELL